MIISYYCKFIPIYKYIIRNIYNTDNLLMKIQDLNIYTYIYI